VIANTAALRALRSIKPDPLYLVHVMYALGLIGPSRCSDAQFIASTAGWERRRTLNSLHELASPALGIVVRVNHRAWCLVDNFLSESTQNVLSGVVVVNNNIESLIYTTTTAESTRRVLSEVPPDYDYLVKRLQGMSVQKSKAEEAVISAAIRGETSEQVEKYIDTWVTHKQSTRGKGIFNIGALVAKSMIDGTAAPEVQDKSENGYDGYLQYQN